jgi:hypothetical protein
VLRLTEFTRGAGPVVATVAAVLMIIVGILVILNPALVAWLAGIGLVLAGVAVLASIFIPSDRIDS